MGQLTTHVLDVSHGIPAKGIKIDLYRCTDNKILIKSVTTNSDGRCNGPLLNEDGMESGKWELEFHVGEYYEAQGVDLPSPKFLDVVSVRFGIADASAHYHVPLLVSPSSYSTYRGS